MFFGIEKNSHFSNNSKTRNLKNCAAVIAITAGLSFANQSFAQTVNDGATLEDIVVVAQKRAENLQKVPIAITALSSDQLAAGGITSSNALGTAVPGIQVTNTNLFFSPRVRGVGTTFFGPGIENPVGLYVDNVYYGSQLMAPTDLSDVEQLAVLKGPQGTLFGRNSTAGVIQMTTRAPEQDFSGEVRTELDQYLTSRNFLYLTGGLAEDLAANLSIKYTTQGEGWGRNLTTGEDIFRTDSDLSIRGKIEWSPSENTSIKLSGDYGRIAGPVGPNNRQFHDAPGNNFFPGLGITFEAANPYDVATNFTAYSSNKSGGGSIAIEQNIGFAKLVSITGYRAYRYNSHADTDGTTVAATETLASQHGQQFTQELQLVSDTSDVFKWVVGAYYYSSKDVIDPLTLYFFDASGSVGGNPFGNFAAPVCGDPTFTLPECTFRIYATLKTRSIAGFAQGTLNLGDHTRLTLGGRYTIENRKISSLLDFSTTGIPLFQVPITGDSTERKPTWRIAIDQDITDRVLAYASYNRGYKSGGFNGFFPTTAPYKPETVDAFEVGVKSELFDRSVRLNVAGFYNTYKNFQLFRFEGASTVATNAPGAETYGVDIDAQWKISSALDLNVGAEWLHAKFTDFPNFPYTLPLPGGGAFPGAIPRSGNGFNLPYAPKLTVNASVNYRTEIAGADILFNVTESYNDGYSFESDNLLRQNSFNTLNASITWTAPNDRLSVSLFGRNILDEVVPSFAGTTSVTGYIASYGNPPATYGASVRYLFGAK